MGKTKIDRSQSNDGANGPRAMSRVLNLFEVLAAQSEGLSLAEISDRMQVSKSTLRNSLLPLLNDGYLLAPSGHYRLGPKAFRLAAVMMSGWSLPLNIRPFMEKLSRETGECVAFAHLDREGMRFIFVDVVASRHGVRFVMSPGRSGELHSGASGQVLLAFQDEAYQEYYLSNAQMSARTSRTIVDAEKLRSRLDCIRQSGVAIAMEESVRDGTAISAPIFGPQGELVGALTVAGPTARLERQIDEISRLLLAVAHLASGDVFPPTASF